MTCFNCSVKAIDPVHPSPATDGLEGSTNNYTRVSLRQVTEPLSTPGSIGKVAALMKDSSKFHVPIPSDTKGSLDKQLRVEKCENILDHLPYFEVYGRRIHRVQFVQEVLRRFDRRVLGLVGFCHQLPATETSRSQDQMVVGRSRPEPSTLEHF
jgi:hypothetical protein